MQMSLAFFTSFMIVISKIILVTNLSSTKIIIDIDRGIALDQIGSYSKQLEESVLHIFVPFNNHCINSPNSNLCEYIQSTSPNIVEIGTILPSEHIAFTKYNKNNISKMINADIQKTLFHHQTEKLITKTGSIVYFLDKNFYVTNYANKISSSELSIDASQRTLARYDVSPASLVLKQIFNGRIGYEFLTDEQIAELLTISLSPDYENFDVNRIQEGIDMFKKTILGQSVYALKSCSIVRDSKSLGGHACFAVSTLFRRIPVGSPSVYTVYRLIPLPIVINQQKYVYSTLPKILGINSIDKTVIKWDDEEFSSSCVSSNVIQCREYPMTIPLSFVSCISSVLGVTQDSHNKCEVTRSQQLEPSIMNIKNNIWLFYSNDESYDCLFHATTGTSAQTISINEPTIIRLPCEQNIHCSRFFIPPTQCANTSVLIKTMNNTDQQLGSMTSIKTIAKRLISIYETSAQNSLMQLDAKIKSNDFSYKHFFDNCLSGIVSIVSLILFGILLLLLKYLKHKIQKQFNKIQVDLNKLKTEYFDEILCQ